MADRFDLKFVNNCGAILETMRDACSSVRNPPIDPSIFSMIETAMNNMDPITMLKYYANETHMYWDKIKERDESFICSNVDLILNSVNIDQGTKNIVLSIINNEKMSKVIDLIKVADERLKKTHPETETSLDYIWRAMEGMVKLSIKYTMQERTKDPKAVSGASYNLAVMSSKWL